VRAVHVEGQVHAGRGGVDRVSDQLAGHEHHVIDRVRPAVIEEFAQLRGHELAAQQRRPTAQMVRHDYRQRFLTRSVGQAPEHGVQIGEAHDLHHAVLHSRSSPCNPRPGRGCARTPGTPRPVESMSVAAEHSTRRTARRGRTRCRPPHARVVGRGEVDVAGQRDGGRVGVDAHTARQRSSRSSGQGLERPLIRPQQTPLCGTGCRWLPTRVMSAPTRRRGC
jgi:hypothetical protein